MAKERAEIAQEDRWDVEAIFPSLEAWEQEFKKWAREGKSPRWPEIASFRGKLCEGDAATVHKALETALNIERHLAKLFTYAHLKHDEDIGLDACKSAFGKITTLLSLFDQETSWMRPEILSISDEKLRAFLQEPALKEYHVYLEKIVRFKPHTLSAHEENLLALSSKALEATHKAFSALSNADLKFLPVKDSRGVQKELTQGTYSLYLRNSDRTLRKEAFLHLHQGFLAFENTFCELLEGVIQTHFFEARARKYSSCLEAALFPHKIDPRVYTSLISAVRQRLGSLHKYLSVRRKLLSYETLHLYDLSVPLVPDQEIAMTYEKAAELCAESVIPLGSKYQTILRQGLLQKRWVDRLENARKRSGAYSSGCYDSMPYILLNYEETFSHLNTLAHEAGHSMHTYFANASQPYHYSHYPIFVAEVASTFNEELLFRHLLERTKNPAERKFLLNQKIDGIRATLFRQAMFAEFELKLHEWVEQGIPFTPQLLKQEYRKLNREYYGEELTLEPESDIEWARIPHFYYNFYVFQYATGISAANALVEKIFKEKDSARDAYLQFLSLGGSLYPLDLLRIAGVDMETSAPVHATMDRFDELVSELTK